jgi:hypothetical protein
LRRKMGEGKPSHTEAKSTSSTTKCVWRCWWSFGPRDRVRSEEDGTFFYSEPLGDCPAGDGTMKLRSAACPTVFPKPGASAFSRCWRCLLSSGCVVDDIPLKSQVVTTGEESILLFLRHEQCPVSRAIISIQSHLYFHTEYCTTITTCSR